MHGGSLTVGADKLPIRGIHMDDFDCVRRKCCLDGQLFICAQIGRQAFQEICQGVQVKLATKRRGAMVQSAERRLFLQSGREEAKSYSLSGFSSVDN